MNKILHVPFAKIDPAERMVYGYASTADRDSDGEIISLDALKGALPGYMKFASVREMHDAKPVGKTKEASVDENGLYIGAKIVDNDAWKMVQEEVYSAFSVGGKVLERDADDPSVIKSMSLMEISLVDVPANPQCRIDLFKVADIGVIEKKKDPKDESDDSEDDQDDDKDDDSKDSEDDPDKEEDDDEDRKKSAREQEEDEVLYKRMVARFGQEKADRVFKLAQDMSGSPVEVPTDEELLKREFSQQERDDAADSGAALPDGSFPIKTKSDLENAIHAYGRAKDKAKAKSHIIARAKALGATNMLPDDWKIVEPELTKVDDEFLATALIDTLYAEFDIEKITALQLTAKKEEVRKLLEFAKITKDITAKAGSRHSRADMDSLQAIHDHASNMGATCADTKAIKPGDLSKMSDKLRKMTSQYTEATETIDKLNKQIADKESYIEKLKKTPGKPEPITAPAELPEGLIAVGKGGEQTVDDANLNTEQKAMKAWRAAREQAFTKRI